MFRTTRLAAAALLVLAGHTPGQAAPIAYEFTGVIDSAFNAASLFSGIGVGDTFVLRSRFDDQVPATENFENGAALYGSSAAFPFETVLTIGGTTLNLSAGPSGATLPNAVGVADIVTLSQATQVGLAQGTEGMLLAYSGFDRVLYFAYYGIAVNGNPNLGLAVSPFAPGSPGALSGAALPTSLAALNSAGARGTFGFSTDGRSNFISGQVQSARVELNAAPNPSSVLLPAPSGPGSSVTAPLLPGSVVIDPVSGLPAFEFDNIVIIDPGSTTWIDPPVAIGYTYELDLTGSSDGQSFASVVIGTNAGDGQYQLVWTDADTQLQQSVSLATGQRHDFVGRVLAFDILGIEAEAGLDPTDGTAFVTGLTFTRTGTASLSQMAITAEVPEPASAWLLALGVMGLGLALRRPGRPPAGPAGSA